MIITISTVLAVFFAFAGSIKVFGWQKMIFEKQLEFFISYGLNRTIMGLVGLVEISGAATIIFQGSILGIYGASAIFLTSIGAIGFHLTFDTWKDAIPAFLTLTLSGILIANNQDAIFTILGNAVVAAF